MLTLFEEVVLLTIDPRTGSLSGGNEFSVRYALAGAMLFDLALAQRIDTDIDTVTVINDAPTGEPIQDELLASLGKTGTSRKVADCLGQIFYHGRDLEGEALAQLVKKGIIKQEATKLLWVIDLTRLRMVDGAPRQLVAVRLARAVLDDEIPEVRDIMLVSLANACGLLSVVLAPAQIEKRAEWIQTLSKIETISRNVGASIATFLDDRARGAAWFGVAHSI